jgi:hypothetical protein
MSIIETIAATLISSILLQVTLEIYRHSIDTIDSIQSMQSVRHNVLLVMHTLQEDIKYAGFTGCQTQLNTITGDSSSMMIAHMKLPYERLTEAMISNREIKIGKTIRLHEHDQMMISDCMHTELATVNKIYMHKSFQLVNLTRALTNTYSPNAVISRYQTRYYKFDAQHHRLYYIDNFNNKITVANDLSAMNIKYIKNTGIEIEYKFKHKTFTQTLYQFVAVK